MRWQLVLPAVGILGLAPALYYLAPRPAAGDGEFELAEATPTPTQIATAVGSSGEGRFDDIRHVTFARLLQLRYREQQLAIGFRFLHDGKIRAMFAPIIPRWNMAEVACQAEAEANSLFGHHFQVDIYETYITAPMRKLGEARVDPGTGRHRVDFDPRFGADPPSQEWIDRMAWRRARMFFEQWLPAGATLAGTPRQFPPPILMRSPAE